MTTTEKLETKKATRPASRWRNRYLALRDYTEKGGRDIARDKEFWATRPWWPTRDTAETSGQGYETRNPDLVKYLGAFPIEGS